MEGRDKPAHDSKGGRNGEIGLKETVKGRKGISKNGRRRRQRVNAIKTKHEAGTKERKINMPG